MYNVHADMSEAWYVWRNLGGDVTMLRSSLHHPDLLLDSLRRHCEFSNIFHQLIWKIDLISFTPLVGSNWLLTVSLDPDSAPGHSQHLLHSPPVGLLQGDDDDDDDDDDD